MTTSCGSAFSSSSTTSGPANAREHAVQRAALVAGVELGREPPILIL